MKESKYVGLIVIISLLNASYLKWKLIKINIWKVVYYLSFLLFLWNTTGWYMSLTICVNNTIIKNQCCIKVIGAHMTKIFSG